MTILRAGVARRTITPPPSIFLVGYGNRVQGNLGIHDDLFVTALLLDDGASRTVILAVDHAFVNAAIVRQIKGRIESECDIPAHAVFVCCSHTHSGPIGYADERSRAEDQQYIAFLVDQLVESAADALQTMQPVTLRAGTDYARININRRERAPSGDIIIGQNPGGLVDHSVQIVQAVGTDNTVVATLVNYACHPVVMGPLNRLVSADWVGSMRKTVEQDTPGLCLFIQGATADLNPRRMRWTADNWDEVEEQGQAVGEAVLRAVGKAKQLNTGMIQAAQVTEWLKLLPATGYNAQIRAFLPPGLSDVDIRAVIDQQMPWRTDIQEWSGSLYAALNAGVLRVGDFALAAIEAEPFVETGLTIKSASPAPMTFVAGYTNGCNSYLPVHSAYAEGGYEVETAPLFYGLPAPIAPGCAEQVTQAIVDMLNKFD